METTPAASRRRRQIQRPPRAFGRSLADFGDLSPAERKLLESCRLGERAVISEERPEEESADNTVRALFIRFLILGGDEQAPIHEYGVDLKGAWITGVLDFNSARVEYELGLINCRIEKVIAWRSFVKVLLLEGSLLVEGLQGEGIVCNSSIYMGLLFRSLGQVNLNLATIKGDLYFGSAKLESPSGPALSFDLANISGDVSLNEGFHAQGAVSFAGAKIGGNLSCESGRFEGTGEEALFFDRAEIAGSVFLRSGFHATGEVRLLGARIGSSLECVDGRFENGAESALNCERVTVAGTVLLGEGFQCKGEVVLYGAKIGGALNCRGGHFENSDAMALDCGSATIAGGMKLTKGFVSSGTVFVSDANISGHFDCTGAMLTNPTGNALECDNSTIGLSLILNSFHAVGSTSFRGARIGRDVDCDRAHFDFGEDEPLDELFRKLDPMVETTGPHAFSLDQAAITGNANLGEDMESRGGISLIGATIGGNLQCHGTLRNADGHALAAHRVSVAGSLRMREGFHAFGSVSLTGAMIAGDLDFRGGHLDANGVALDLENISVSGNAFLSDDFQAAGEVALPNASIGRSLKCNGGTFDGGAGYALCCDLARVGGGFFVRRTKFVAGKIGLSSMHVGNLCDDSESWKGAQGTLELDGFTYGRLVGDAPTNADERIEWLKGQVPSHLREEFRPQPWEQLIGVLRAMGHPEQARAVAVAKQDQMRRAGKMPGGAAIFHWFYGALVGYGYLPWRLIRLTAFVWLFCALAYWWGTNPGPAGPPAHLLASPPAKGKPEPPDYANFVPLIYSADVLLPVVDLGYKNEWQPVVSKGNKPLLAGQLLRFLYWFEIAFGWVVGLLLVAMLGNLVKKD